MENETAMTGRNIRIKDDQIQALKRIAYKLDRSVAWCIRKAIADWIKAEEAKKEPQP